MITAVQGQVEKINLTVQDEELNMIPQPAHFPKISIYDETESLVTDAEMTEISPGIYYYNFATPIDKLGEYIVYYRIYDSSSVEKSAYEDMKIVNVDGAIEPRNFNVEAL